MLSLQFNGSTSRANKYLVICLMLLVPLLHVGAHIAEDDDAFVETEKVIG